MRRIHELFSMCCLTFDAMANDHLPGVRGQSAAVDAARLPGCC